MVITDVVGYRYTSGGAIDGGNVSNLSAAVIVGRKNDATADVYSTIEFFTPTQSTTSTGGIDGYLPADISGYSRNIKFYGGLRYTDISGGSSGLDTLIAAENYPRLELLEETGALFGYRVGDANDPLTLNENAWISATGNTDSSAPAALSYSSEQHSFFGSEVTFNTRDFTVKARSGAGTCTFTLGDESNETNGTWAAYMYLDEMVAQTHYGFDFRVKSLTDNTTAFIEFNDQGLSYSAQGRSVSYYDISTLTYSQLASVSLDTTSLNSWKAALGLNTPATEISDSTASVVLTGGNVEVTGNTLAYYNVSVVDFTTEAVANAWRTAISNLGFSDGTTVPTSIADGTGSISISSNSSTGSTDALIETDTLTFLNLKTINFVSENDKNAWRTAIESLGFGAGTGSGVTVSYDRLILKNKDTGAYCEATINGYNKDEYYWVLNDYTGDVPDPEDPTDWSQICATRQGDNLLTPQTWRDSLDLYSKSETDTQITTVASALVTSGIDTALTSIRPDLDNKSVITSINSMSDDITNLYTLIGDDSESSITNLNTIFVRLDGTNLVNDQATIDTLRAALQLSTAELNDTYVLRDGSNLIDADDFRAALSVYSKSEIGNIAGLKTKAKIPVNAINELYDDFTGINVDQFALKDASNIDEDAAWRTKLKVYSKAETDAALDDKADKDSKNLTEIDKQSWRKNLDVYSKSEIDAMLSQIACGVLKDGKLLVKNMDTGEWNLLSSVGTSPDALQPVLEPLQ